MHWARQSKRIGSTKRVVRDNVLGQMDSLKERPGRHRPIRSKKASTALHCSNVIRVANASKTARPHSLCHPKKKAPAVFLRNRLKVTSTFRLTAVPRAAGIAWERPSAGKTNREADSEPFLSVPATIPRFRRPWVGATSDDRFKTGIRGESKFPCDHRLWRTVRDSRVSFRLGLGQTGCGQVRIS